MLGPKNVYDDDNYSAAAAYAYYGITPKGVALGFLKGYGYLLRAVLFECPKELAKMAYSNLKERHKVEKFDQQEEEMKTK